MSYDDKAIDTIFEILDDLKNEIATQKATVASLTEKLNATIKQLEELESEYKMSCQNLTQVMLALQKQTADLDWVRDIRSSLHKGLIMLIITLLSSLASWALFFFKLLAKKSGLE